MRLIPFFQHLAGGAILFCMSAYSAWAAIDLEVELVRGSGETISDLEIEIDGVENLPESERAPFAGSWVRVDLKGTFRAQDSNLIHRLRGVRVDEDGNFKFSTGMLASKTALTLYNVGPTGKIEPETLTLLAKNWVEWRASMMDDDRYAKQKTNLWSASLGVTTMGFEQKYSTGLPLTPVLNFGQKAISAKIGYERVLQSRSWSVGGNIFGNVLPFGSDDSRGRSFRAIAGNARVGWITPFATDPWSLTISGGFYLNLMLTSPTSFGYQFVGGPQIYPVVRRVIDAWSSAYGYLKFSPVGEFGGSSLIGVRGLGSREIAVGGGYTRRFSPEGRAWTFSLDYANLAVENLDAVTSTGAAGGKQNAYSSSLTLGVGTSF
jgi:hypothetical protein